MKQFTSQTQKVGKLGEDLVARYYREKGFEIIEQNYTKKWGEIDIVAQKGDLLHFIEVKSIAVSNVNDLGVYRPEENVHPKKLERFMRTVETYLLEKGIGDEKPWQVDVCAVLIDRGGKTAKIRVVENIIGE